MELTAEAVGASVRVATGLHMHVTPTTPLCVSEHVLIQELDDESVLLDMASEVYFGLDDVGTQILKALERAGTIQEACAVLLRTYRVPPEQLLADVTALVGQLAEQGIVRVDDEPTARDLSAPGRR